MEDYEINLEMTLELLLEISPEGGAERNITSSGQPFVQCGKDCRCGSPCKCTFDSRAYSREVGFDNDSSAMITEMV
jgi:hypothetical protein